MSLDQAYDIWKLLKPTIDVNEMGAASDLLINYLIDENHSPAEIKQAFRGDKDIKEALSYFLETPADGLYHADVVDHDEDPFEVELFDDEEA